MIERFILLICIWMKICLISLVYIIVKDFKSIHTLIILMLSIIIVLITHPIVFVSIIVVIVLILVIVLPSVFCIGHFLIVVSLSHIRGFSIVRSLLLVIIFTFVIIFSFIWWWWWCVSHFSILSFILEILLSPVLFINNLPVKIF